MNRSKMQSLQTRLFPGVKVIHPSCWVATEPILTEIQISLSLSTSFYPYQATMPKSSLPSPELCSHLWHKRGVCVWRDMNTNKCLGAIPCSHGAAARDVLRITLRQVLERKQSIHNWATSCNNNSQRNRKGKAFSNSGQFKNKAFLQALNPRWRRKRRAGQTNLRTQPCMKPGSQITKQCCSPAATSTEVDISFSPNS